MSTGKKLFFKFILFVAQNNLKVKAFKKSYNRNKLTKYQLVLQILILDLNIGDKFKTNSRLLFHQSFGSLFILEMGRAISEILLVYFQNKLFCVCFSLQHWRAIDLSHINEISFSNVRGQEHSSCCITNSLCCRKRTSSYNPFQFNFISWNIKYNFEGKKIPMKLCNKEIFKKSLNIICSYNASL